MMVKPRVDSHSWKRALFIGIALLFGSALLMVFFRKSLPDILASPLAASRDEDALHTAHSKKMQALWNSLPLQHFKGIEIKESPGGQSITDAIMSNLALTTDMRKALNSKILGELAARSATPAEYVRFAYQDITTRWLDSKDGKKWDVLDYWWQSQLKKPVDRSNAPQQLEECLSHLYDKRGAAWTGMGTPPDGMKLVVFTVRTKAEVYVRLESILRKEGGDELYNRWMLSDSATPLAFRTPKRNLESLLAQSGSAQIVVCMLIIENAAHERFNWATVMFWDPQLGLWTTESMNRKGWLGVPWY
jgi:hypothetical protein